MVDNDSATIAEEEGGGAAVAAGEAAGAAAEEAASEEAEGAELEAATVVGSLTLVDLAGSERNYETIKMTAAMHRESAQINKALMALKECFRAHHHLRRGRSRISHTIALPMTRTSVKHRSSNRGGRTSGRAGGRAGKGEGKGAGKGEGKGGAASGDVEVELLTYDRTSTSVVSSNVRPPYRASMLTRVLRGSFEDAAHRTAVIATVSPTSTDMHHTLNTLDHVCLMSPEGHDENLDGIRREVTVEVPLVDMYVDEHHNYIIFSVAKYLH